MTKTALVTGGSRGIGRACALELAAAGCNVAITYAGNDAKAQETVAELEKLGVKAKAYKFDVKDKEAAVAAIEEIHKEFETIDILVNNAGITRDNLIIRMSDEEWESVINTNLTGVFNVTKPVCKIMMKQRQGAIVNMSSIVGISGNAGQSNYSAAKAGLIGFTKSLAKELASRNIRVNAVAPGFIQTDMTAGLDAEAVAQHIPLKRLGQPEDIAKTVKFLAIDGTYITAQVLGVDGGLSI
ncbi:MAG: 3-oxoacyl-[acyl-carrier-protein] reductase [bacterium]|nr:3-oxoacyl-[acyl-carrier-protein] reductase [bacterium]